MAAGEDIGLKGGSDAGSLTGEPSPPGGFDALPASAIAHPVADLAALGMIGPPQRPGLVGSIERFELSRLLGSGGMGVVFLARDTQNGGLVALKLLRPEFREEPRAVRRFLTEARHMHKLKHPNTVPVLEVHERAHGPYFVMPFFELGSLALRIKPGAPLGPSAILQVALPVAEALAFAHRKGIIHRDIKPANILLQTDGAGAVADFGLARTVFNDSIVDVEKDQCEGTAPYMSPQVAAGEAEDTRCDIYSFGALLYELLTSQPPYQGSSAKAIRDQILAGSPPTIREINRKADPQLAKVAEWAMAREHRDRYANMGDVVEDLRRLSAAKAPLGPHWVWSLRAGLRTVPKRVWIPAVLLVTVAPALWFTWPRPRFDVTRFTAPQVTSWTGAVPARWRSLHGRDLLVAQNNGLLAFSASGRLIDQSWRCFEPGVDAIGLDLVCSAQGEGLDEAFVSWSGGTNCSLEVVNANGFSLKRFNATGAQPNLNNRIPSRTSSLNALCVVQPAESQDGRRKVVAFLQTAYGGSPRALVAFDYATGRLEWQQPIGPILYTVEKIALRDGGHTDFVCGSLAVCNGHSANGSDDGHSYVFAVSGTGDLIWRKEMSGPYSVTSVSVVPGAEPLRDKLFAWVKPSPADHARHRPGMSRVVQLDNQGQVLANYEAGVCLESCQALNTETNGPVRVLCSDCDGYIHVLDASGLELLRKVRILEPRPRPNSLDRAEISLLKVTRLTGGGGLRILAQCQVVRQRSFDNPGFLDRKSDELEFEDLEIRLLDTELASVARYHFADKSPAGLGWAVKTADMDGDGLDEILSLSDRIEVLKLRGR
jgi:hypothetical protein